MAQINLTLYQEEILQLLSENRDDGFRTLLQGALNIALQGNQSP